MRTTVLSPRAQADVQEIWAYSRERWGPDQAEAYIRQIQRALQTLAADPRRGRACDHIRAGYSRFSVEQHVVFYRLTEEAIDVVRILHQRMDFDRHL